ncbi:hypothetical protein HDU98_002419 [Podochytrium sp. JEL0797]|nr:hypothetical protein HDU98_002419 [Podochytrium sp. JEL0797]
MWTLALFLLQTLSLRLDSWFKTRGVVVRKLLIHPIKSCKGVSVQSAALGPYGFEMDRIWMIVDAEGKFVTQREQPRLAVVSVELLAKGTRYEEGGEMRVSAEGMTRSLVVEFKSAKQLAALPKVATDVWGSAVGGLDEGNDAADWFSEFLGTKARLIVKDPESVRTLKERHTPEDTLFDRDHKGQTAFADGFPYLIATLPSLDIINARLPPRTIPRTIEHFRPNIVFAADASDPHSHLPPFAEERWKKIRVGSEVFYIASHCGRCSMPGNDIATGGASDPQISKTMSKFRRVDPGMYESCFGMNAIAKGGRGVVKVGDVVEILEDGVVHNSKVGVWRV